MDGCGSCRKTGRPGGPGGGSRQRPVPRSRYCSAPVGRRDLQSDAVLRLSGTVVCYASSIDAGVSCPVSDPKRICAGELPFQGVRKTAQGLFCFPSFFVLTTAHLCTIFSPAETNSAFSSYSTILPSIRAHIYYIIFNVLYLIVSPYVADALP